MSSTTTGLVVKPTAAFPPPPGEKANLDNPEIYLYGANIIGLSICLGFICIAYGLRSVAKHKFRIHWRGEDYMCLSAFVLSVMYIWLCFMMSRYGEGYHQWEVTRHNYVEILRWLYASSIVWIPAAFAVKATLLLMTAHIFGVFRRFSLLIRLYVWFLLIAYLPVQFVKIFICWPIAHYWDDSIPGSCLDQPKIFLTDTAIAIVTDFIILLLPIPLIWRLHMPVRKKVKVAIMLGAGGAAVAVACYREYKIYLFQSTKDRTGDFVVMNLCGTIELTIGFVCTCLPLINLLWEHRPPSHEYSNRPRTRSGSGLRPGNLVNGFASARRPSGSGNRFPTNDNDVQQSCSHVSNGVVVRHYSEGSLYTPESDMEMLEWSALGQKSSKDARSQAWVAKKPIPTEVAVPWEQRPRDEEAVVGDPPAVAPRSTLEQSERDTDAITVPNRTWDVEFKGPPSKNPKENEARLP